MVSQCSGPARGHWTDGQTETSTRHQEACESHDLERVGAPAWDQHSPNADPPCGTGKGPSVLGSGTCVCSVSAGQTGGGLQVWMGSVPRLAWVVTG